jgi:hypothetical protein
MPNITDVRPDLSEPSRCGAEKSDALKCMKPPSQIRRRAFVRQFLKRWRRRRSILAFAFRSFHGRIRNQFARDLDGVDFGPAFLSSPDGSLVLNVRSAVRNLYTEKLLAIHPWVDHQDLEIFLMGFDAGEQWSMCTHGKLQEHRHFEIGESWLYPEDRDAISRYVNECNRDIISG